MFLKKMAVVSLQTAADQLKYLKGVHIINLVDSVNYAVNTDSVKFLAAANKAKLRFST